MGSAPESCSKTSSRMRNVSSWVCRPNPEYRALMEGKSLHGDEFYEKMLSLNLDESERESLSRRRMEAAEFSKTLSQWNETYESHLEYCKARIFVDLREGKLQAAGIQIPGKNEEEATDHIEGNELDLSKQPIVSIRQNEWTARKIDWKSSALFGDEYTFCWVHFSTESVLAAYPIPSLPPGR
jgi:hypothetical protein